MLIALGPEYLNLRKTTIYGGSNEIQKYSHQNGIRLIMNLTLSEEQKLIKDSARKYLELIIPSIKTKAL